MSIPINNRHARRKGLKMGRVLQIKRLHQSARTLWNNATGAERAERTVRAAKSIQQMNMARKI